MSYEEHSTAVFVFRPGCSGQGHIHETSGGTLLTQVGRRDLYEIVLVQGTMDDVCELINETELVRLWDQMYLRPWVRSAWRPLIDSAHRAA